MVHLWGVRLIQDNLTWIGYKTATLECEVICSRLCYFKTCPHNFQKIIWGDFEVNLGKLCAKGPHSALLVYRGSPLCFLCAGCSAHC